MKQQVPPTLPDQPVVGDVEVGLEVARHDGEAEGHHGQHCVQPGGLELGRGHAETERETPSQAGNLFVTLFH